MNLIIEHLPLEFLWILSTKHFMSGDYVSNVLLGPGFIFCQKLRGGVWKFQTGTDKKFDKFCAEIFNQSEAWIRLTGQSAAE